MLLLRCLQYLVPRQTSLWKWTVGTVRLWFHGWPAWVLSSMRSRLAVTTAASAARPLTLPAALTTSRAATSTLSRSWPWTTTAPAFLARPFCLTQVQKKQNTFHSWLAVLFHCCTAQHIVSSFSSLPAPECQRCCQLLIKRHDDFLGRLERRRPCFGFRQCRQRARHPVMQLRHRFMYYQQLDVWRSGQHSSYICQRFLPQSAQSDPQRPLRYKFYQ